MDSQSTSIEFRRTGYSVRERWGDAVPGGETGFQPVPDVLLRSQSRLGVSNTQLAVLLNITLHWWHSERWPYPRPSTIAKRMGTDVRTVERAILKLEEKSLVRRLPPERNEDNLVVRRFDLSGLVKTCTEIAREMRAGRE